jgi:hypothetical protein
MVASSLPFPITLAQLRMPPATVTQPSLAGHMTCWGMTGHATMARRFNSCHPSSVRTK